MIAGLAIGVTSIAGVVAIAQSREVDLARTPRTQVWVVEADGTGARQLTDWPGSALPLDWSPDGRWILVQSDRDGDWDLWLVSADGTEERHLTDEDGMESFARFSPDGTLVAFTADLRVDADLWLVGADGQDPRPIATGEPTDEWLPAWSPDGDELVYFRTPRGALTAPEMWRSRSDGSRPRKVATEADVLWADWSPDGSRLAAGTIGGELALLSASGSEVDLAAGVDLAWHPRWTAPDQIVFARGGVMGEDGLLHAGPDQPRDLWTVSLDGQVALFLPLPGDQSLPVPAPDGSRIAFAGTPSS